MPSWPWSPRLSRSLESSRSPSVEPQTPTTPGSASLSPWVEPDSDQDGDNDDDEIVNSAIKETSGKALKHNSYDSNSQRQNKLKSATRSKTLRRPIPSFDEFANSIPEEATPGLVVYENGAAAASSSSTTAAATTKSTTTSITTGFDEKPSQEILFPGNPEDFHPIEEVRKTMPPVLPPPPPRRSSSRASSRTTLNTPTKERKGKEREKGKEKQHIDTDLPLLNRELCDIEMSPKNMPSESKSGLLKEESTDAEVIRLRKMCEVLQEKIIQMSQHTPPAPTSNSRRSSLIIGDRLSRTKFKDIPSEELATEGHRVAHVMRVMNEQLQKKLELREKLLFQRNAHISQLEQTHATQIEEFHAATKTDIQKMVTAYQKEISEMHQRNLLQITNLRNELEGKMKIKEMQSHHEKSKLLSEIDILKRREADLIASHEIGMQEREELFEKDLASLRESIVATEAEFRKNYEAKLETLREEHEKEIAELKKSIITRPLDLSDDVDRDIVAQKIADLESSLSEHIEELTAERERSLELQVALDASEFSRQTEKEKLEHAVQEESAKREDFQKHEQRIRAQLLAASDEKRKECLKHERARYERLVREENIRRKAASDRYESELKELKQKNAEQVELFRLQKESIFELHERDLQEMEKRIAAEQAKMAEYDTLLETVESSRKEDRKRFECEKADIIAAHDREKEAFAQERLILVAAQTRDKKLANAEKEALETDLKRMSNNCEELLHRRVRDSIGSASTRSRRSYTISESGAPVSEEDEAEKRIAAEVAKVTAYSESQQKDSTEKYERQTAILKAELQAIQKLQTKINAQVAEDEKKIAELTTELDSKNAEIERQAGIIADLELQLESEKGKFKDILERNVSLEKNLWEQKEAASEATKDFQSQIKTLNDEKQSLLATIATAGVEDKESAGEKLKQAISLGYEAELQELEARHKEVIQTNINALFKLENLVRHFVNMSGEPPRSPSFIGTPRTPCFLGDVSTPITDVSPSLTTARSASSGGSIRSMPLHEPSFEPTFEPTFEPSTAKEGSMAEADYVEALKKAEAAYTSTAKSSEDRGEVLLDIQTQIRSFKLQQLSFPASIAAA
ncbi:hypothetical protein TWF569_009271 [Orbilia oligospora]|uniref:Uncharacterized protein n=1 Tax=Orbilia oligospora TaxID=2813651 RepID=A0A7C8NTI5_ORBOL|nr:hypothetical protein TWF569_009271 [Orbilia oligospora]KAF3141262.1 hypothetical protein TWF703_002057 [Orbilia oligospora]